MNKKLMYRVKPAPLVFFVIGCIGLSFINISGDFIINEVYIRFIRNTITAMALIIPIWAGMGLNFSIVVGAMCSQAAMIFIVDKQILTIEGLILALVLSIIYSIFFGWIVGNILNKARGKEMIVSIVVGLLATNIYQLIFMVGYGTIIPNQNKSILLSRGIGVRNMVDIYPLKEIFMGNSYTHLFVIAIVAFIIYYTGRTKLGNQFKVTRDSISKAKYLGINTDRVRVTAIIMSTVLASIGHLMFMLEIGNVNVYTGHLNIDIFASAALLAGGATLFDADVKNAIIGVILFHFVFIITPLFGKTVFNNIAIGEYFRSFVAYGTIVIVFIINLKTDNTI